MYLKEAIATDIEVGTRAPQIGTAETTRLRGLETSDAYTCAIVIRWWTTAPARSIRRRPHAICDSCIQVEIEDATIYSGPASIANTNRLFVL